MTKPTNTRGRPDPSSQGTAPEKVSQGGNDPGGARSKGYSAEPGPGPRIPSEGPVPLVPDAEVRAHAQKPDQSQAVQPSSAPTGEAANQRVMGADR